MMVQLRFPSDIPCMSIPTWPIVGWLVGPTEGLAPVPTRWSKARMALAVARDDMSRHTRHKLILPTLSPLVSSFNTDDIKQNKARFSSPSSMESP